MKNKLVLVVFLLFLSIVTIFLAFYQDYQRIKEELIILNFEKEELIKNLDNLKKEYYILNESYNILSYEKEKLNKSLEELKKEYSILNKSYISLYKNYSDLLNSYQALERKYEELSINYSLVLDQYMNYLEYKSKLQSYVFYNLNYDFSGKLFISTIEKYCISGRTLNYPCLISILKDKFEFSYRELRTFYDKVDIEEFIRNKSGDCKSWSFFSVAIINYFYRIGKIDSIILYQPYRGERFILYYDGPVYYYYPDAKDFMIDLRKRQYLYVFCYYNLSGSSGHCISGVSDVIINPKNLETSEVLLFEPQDGRYLGTLKEFLVKNREVFLSHIFLQSGHLYFRPLDLLQWGEDVWVWI
ncbi:MAG: hypothetical protein QXR54_01905 [Nanopusillaceae archaeon]